MQKFFVDGHDVDLVPERIEPTHEVYVPERVTMNRQVRFLEVPGQSCYLSHRLGVVLLGMLVSGCGPYQLGAKVP